jgi:hypothetical protein
MPKKKLSKGGVSGALKTAPPIKFQRITKPVTKTEHSSLSNVLKLSTKSLRVLTSRWLPFTIVIVIYLFFTLLLVKGFSTNINTQQLKINSFGASSHKASILSSSWTAFSGLISNNPANATSSTSNVSPGVSDIFQTLLFIVFSLIFIWMIREVVKNNRITIRDSFYKSQNALIPFLIVCFYIVLETLPLILGLYLYTQVFNNGLATHSYEKVVWFLICLGFVCLSIYLLVSSIFAIFIVTLPETRPFQALRSSWRLSKGRRVTIIRKFMFLPIAMFISVGIISVIFLVLIPGIADWVYFLLGIIALPVVLSYLYNLYRELI